MDGLVEYLEQYRVKKNVPVEAFLTALHKQIAALDGNLTRRSWAKKSGDGYLITLGKLAGEYSLPNKQEAKDFLNMIASETRKDDEFRSLVEAAYGTPRGAKPAVEKPSKAGKPKA